MLRYLEYRPAADNLEAQLDWLHLNVLLPALTSLLSFGFALVLVGRFVGRHQPYYLVWTLGLLWYALAAGSEAIGALSAWTPVLYKLWYTTGAIGVAAYSPGHNVERLVERADAALYTAKQDGRNRVRA